MLPKKKIAISALKAKVEKLNQASHKISEILYAEAAKQQAGAAAGEAGGADNGAKAGAQAETTGANEEEVVDAEYEVEDEK